MSRTLIMCCLMLASAPTLAVDSRTELDPTERATAPWSRATLESHWGLAANEIVRLEAVTPIASPWTDVAAMTPYELLGLYARSAAERQRYAERFLAARVDHQRRTLDWSIAVVEAEESGAIDTSLETRATTAFLARRGYNGPSETLLPSSSVAAPRDRLHVFVTTRDCGTCAQAFRDALDAVEAGRFAGVDVVFTDMDRQDRETATRWAVAHGIGPAMIERKQVTLNWESASWARERGDRSVPLVLSATTGEAL